MEVRVRNAPHDFMYLNTWAPVGGIVWKDYGTLRKWSLPGGSMSLWVASLPVLAASCMWLKCDLFIS